MEYMVENNVVKFKKVALKNYNNINVFFDDLYKLLRSLAEEWGVINLIPIIDSIRGRDGARMQLSYKNINNGESEITVNLKNDDNVSELDFEFEMLWITRSNHRVRIYARITESREESGISAFGQIIVYRGKDESEFFYPSFEDSISSVLS